ncbi:MAG: hypothetical protein ACO2OZ_07185 [Acidilobaceae archaeon]
MATLVFELLGATLAYTTSKKIDGRRGVQLLPNDFLPVGAQVIGSPIP